MPARERVQAFVALVEAGKYVEAIEQYYAADASMQENNAPPRKGRDALVKHEQGVMASFKSIRTLPVETFLVDGDRVVIHWTFEFTRPDGTVLRLEEVALQRWRGDEIVEERFFYDPGQMRG
jgi:ketosteroid isomerase-like protein